MQGNRPVSIARDHFATKIRAAYARTLEGILEIGKALLEAKAELPHGQFTAMVKADLPFGPRQAEKYLAIARHPVLANANCSSLLLPSSVTALYHLSQFEPDELTSAMREMARTKQKFDDETDVAKILFTKDIKRRLGRPEVTFQGVMAAVNKIRSDVSAAPPPPPTPTETSRVTAPPGPKISAIKDGAVQFPDNARRLADPGLSDAEILPAPPNPARTQPAEQGAWTATMAENQRIANETRQALAAGQEILGLLRDLNQKFTHAAVPPLFEHKRDEALDLAREILKHMAGCQ